MPELLFSESTSCASRLEKYERSIYMKKESVSFHVILLSSRMSLESSHSLRYSGLARYRNFSEVTTSSAQHKDPIFWHVRLEDADSFFKKQDFYGWPKVFKTFHPTQNWTRSLGANSLKLRGFVRETRNLARKNTCVFYHDLKRFFYPRL